jgi:hypothetical protein
MLFSCSSLISKNYFILYGLNSFMSSFFWQRISKIIAPNVPAVYDVLPARIRACVARPGLAKCGGVLAWEWSAA